MKRYLSMLIKEKGVDLDTEIKALHSVGHFGVLYVDLINFIQQMPSNIKEQIRKKLIMIDFHNGDVFDFLNHLAKGMIASMEA